MKPGVISFSLALVLALFAAPLAAWAHSNPDFDDDAKPILRMQPGLLQYVESRFDVKDTGTAKYPGDDDRRPAPPYIFRARPLGSSGPFNLRLLIQPGQPGHILGVVDITKVHLNAPAGGPSQPAVANQPPPQTEPSAPAAAAEVPAPSTQAPAAQQPSEPTADTPSGPIMAPGSQAPSSTQPNLAPPPDPAPANQ
jgi:hypothetical protein